MKHRPVLHMTPPQGWINDPNGPIYYDRLFHLFYQHQPQQQTWGPMHWGHAISRDLIRWQHEPIALCPDHEGAAFSGSAFLHEGKLHLCYTLDHATKGQRQAVAVSEDGGLTFQRQAIVLSDSQRPDFRDPKLFWHEGCGHWVMVLAAGDHARIYVSRDLTDFHLSDTLQWPGLKGVWECPDLFDLNGQWVFLLSLNLPAQQDLWGFGMVYFLGGFDGRTFTVTQAPRRLDRGLDFYAGVTFSQMQKRRVLIAWMNCWHYAHAIPSDGVYRGSMTLPRELHLIQDEDGWLLGQSPLRELSGTTLFQASSLPNSFSQHVSAPCFSLSGIFAPEGSIVLRNDSQRVEIRLGEVVTLDRSRSGAVDFSPYFAPLLQSTRRKRNQISLWLLYDRQSLEVFIDAGKETLTSLVFPHLPYDRIEIESPRAEAVRIVGFR